MSFLFLLGGVFSVASSEYLPEALAVDGECLQGSSADTKDPDCAVSALQRIAHGLSSSEGPYPESASDPEPSAAVGETAEANTSDPSSEVSEPAANSTPAEETAVAEKPVVVPGECNDDTPCSAGRMCVTKLDNSWAQCLPTTRKEFQAECSSWDKDMRIAATAKLTQCDTAKCESSAMCSAGWTCVPKADNSWAQCVPQNGKLFRRMCVHWNDAFRLSAIKAIGLNCPNSRCYSHEWCLHGHKCAMNKGDGWGQCISCKKKSFQTNCYSWTSDFAEQAERVCGHECQNIKEIGSWN